MLISKIWISRNLMVISLCFFSCDIVIRIKFSCFLRCCKQTMWISTPFLLTNTTLADIIPCSCYLDIIWSILTKHQRLSWFRPIYPAKGWEKDCGSWEAKCLVFSSEGGNASSTTCRHFEPWTRHWTFGC